MGKESAEDVVAELEAKANKKKPAMTSPSGTETTTKTPDNKFPARKYDQVFNGITVSREDK